MVQHQDVEVLVLVAPNIDRQERLRSRYSGPAELHRIDVSSEDAIRGQTHQAADAAASRQCAVILDAHPDPVALPPYLLVGAPTPRLLVLEGEANACGPERVG